MSNKKIAYLSIFPATLILAALLAVLKWPYLIKKAHYILELKAILVLLPKLPYLSLFISFIIGFFFNSIGMILASLVTAISYSALCQYGQFFFIKGAVGFLLPLNLMIFALIKKKQALSPILISFFTFVALQIFAVCLFQNVINYPTSGLILYIKNGFPQIARILFGLARKIGLLATSNYLFRFKNIASLPFLAFLLSFFVIFMRFLKSKDVLLIGFLGAIISLFFGITADSLQPAGMIFFSATGFLFITAAIESSFSIAYIDALTGIPGRRSLNGFIGGLSREYTIAMVDIDYFKKLNDTYGHDTGDQVLRMIAQKLSKVHSDAKVFRYGGEEFVIVFPEKTPKEAYHYLENCRRTIENTPFIIRGKDRKQRSAVDRGKYLRNTQEEIKVTVSIGVASSNINPADAEKVLIAADEMLYDAKETGRNKVVLHGR